MAYTEFYVQPTGSNLNSGSTNTDAPTHEYASGDWVQSTGVFTVASGNPESDGVAVGDFASVYADGATQTGFVGRVTARTSTTITVSFSASSGASGTSPANGTGDRTLRIGGAWAGPSGAVGFPFGFIRGQLTNVASEDLRVNIKAGTNYAVSAAMNNNKSSSGRIILEGYGSVPGDGGKAIINGGNSGTGYNLLSSTTGRTTFKNLIFDSNGATGGAATSLLTLSTGTGVVVFNCIFRNSRGHGLNSSGIGGLVIECLAHDTGQGGSSTYGFQGSTTTFLNCISRDNAGRGFGESNSEIVCLNCISYRNTIGFLLSGGSGVLINCDAYDNTGDGFSFFSSAVNFARFVNINAVKNGGWGINLASVARQVMLLSVGFGSGSAINTSGMISSPTSVMNVEEVGTVIYPADTTPWADPDNGNFDIVLPEAIGAGYGQFPEGLTTGYPDIGAAQHQPSSGSVVKSSYGFA